MRSLIAAAVAAAFLVTGAPAQAGETVTNDQLSSGSSFNWNLPALPTNNDPGNQGAKLVVSGGGCTLGYITDEYALTATHCGDLVIGDTVTNSSGGAWGTIVDSGHANPGVGSYPRDDDWAIIKLNDGVTPGSNIHSGDTLVPASEVSVGDEVCLFGQKTGYERCTTIDEVRDGYFLTTEYVSQNGDSGGPWYIPGEGMVGVNKGSTGSRGVITALNSEIISYLQ